MRWEALCISLLVICGVRAQEPLDTARYARFKEAFQSAEHEGLNELSEELSHSSDPWLRELAILGEAAYAFRTDDIKDCLRSLDSLDHAAVPTHLLIGGLSRKIRALALKRVLAFDLAHAAIVQGLTMLAGTIHVPERADMLIVEAEIERRQGRYDDAFEHLREAEELADSVGHTVAHANVLINRGNIYFSQKRYPEAWTTYKACLDLSSRNGFPLIANNAIMNLGSVAHMMDRYDEAIAIYDSLYRTLGQGSPQLRSDLLTHMGFAHAELGHHEKAIQLFEAALERNSEIGNDAPNAKLYQHMSSSQWALGRREEALTTLRRSLELAEKHGWKELEAEIHFKLFRWYKDVGRPEPSLNELEHYTTLEDSLVEVQYGEKMSRLEIQYGMEKKEQQLRVTEAELSGSRAEERRREIQRNGVIAIAVLLLAVAILLWRNVRHIRTLRAQERSMHDQQVDDLMKAQEIRVLDAVVEAQQDERQRIAKDLHDHLGSMLSAIKLQFSTVEGRFGKMEAEQKEHYQLAFDLLDNAVEEVRRISHSMVRGTIAQFGLKGALEDLASTIEAPGKLHVELNLFGIDERLGPEIEIAVYRMVQEMVTNILKHAKATQLTIQLTRDPGMLNVLVEDNGVGFEPGKVAEGMGMGNLRARAADINAVMNIDSHGGRGTTISIDIPLS